jgi:hypothetical protein
MFSEDGLITRWTCVVNYQSVALLGDLAESLISTAFSEQRQMTTRWRDISRPGGLKQDAGEVSR